MISTPRLVFVRPETARIMSFMLYILCIPLLEYPCVRKQGVLTLKLPCN